MITGVSFSPHVLFSLPVSPGNSNAIRDEIPYSARTAPVFGPEKDPQTSSWSLVLVQGLFLRKAKYLYGSRFPQVELEGIKRVIQAIF
ncbi:unnamed protein product [Urochloa humidicola]